MGNLNVVGRRVEYGRYYAEAELTEDAVYVKGQVPEDYAGKFIAQLHVCFAVVSTDLTGRIQLTTYNPPELLDKDNASGLQILDPDNNELRPGTGAAPVQLIWEANDKLPTVLKTQADAVWAMAKREIGEWYL